MYALAPVGSLAVGEDQPAGAAAGGARPRLGYAMAASAASLWGLNGTVSKVLLASGYSALRLAQVRSAGAFVGLLAIAALTAPERLRPRRRELLPLALFGVLGLAFVQWFYFLALHRLAIGVALLIQYLAPLLLALWARLVMHERVRARVWMALALALALALAGLALVLDMREHTSLPEAGPVFALLAALTYAFYLLLAERALPRRDPLTLLVWGFGLASLFWSAVVPWWDFLGRLVSERVPLLGRLAHIELPASLLLAALILAGTIVPFFLLVSALRHLPATGVGIAAMLEPVVATVVAWAWLGESLDATQLCGGGVVLVAILLAQTARRAADPAHAATRLRLAGSREK